MTTPDASIDSLSLYVKVAITGRNVEVPEHFAERVNAKLAKGQQPARGNPVAEHARPAPPCPGDL